MNFAEVAFQLSGFLFIATICVIMFIGARIIRKKVPLFRKNRVLSKLIDKSEGAQRGV